MRLPVFLFSIFVLSPLFATEGEHLVKSVAVPGTALAVKLTTQVGQPYDLSTLTRDVRYLWSLGRFEDIRVEATPSEDGIAVVFRTRPAVRMRLREILIEPSTCGLQLKAAKGSLIDRRSAEAIATEARRQLADRGYPRARVDYEFIRRRDEVDLKLKVDQGDSLRVKQVNFVGDPGIRIAQLRSGLDALRARRILPRIPWIWGGWRLLPSYTPEAAESDAARLESLYLSKGYLDAAVTPREADISGSDARVTFDVRAGQRFTLDTLRVGQKELTGASPAAACSTLFAERRRAEREGVLDFSARMEVQRSSGGHADAVTSFTLGQAYRVGRIEFTGNRRFSDASIRRNFLLDEGAPVDDRLLRRSLARLNRTGRFENISERNVIIARNEKTGLADIRLSLIEPKFGRWNISGPVGPPSFGGALEGSISARLPAWGRGIFELSTYTASVAAFAFASPIPGLAVASASRIPVLMLRRPFSPGDSWLSGFTVAPQIGWRGSSLLSATTQLQQRLQPLLAGDRGLIPDLPVTVSRPEGEAVMVCPAPRPRLYWPRVAAGVSLRIFGSMMAF